jgi:hypothetical protein
MAQQQLDMLSQNPLAEAEQIKQQGAIARDQQKHQVDLMKTEAKIALDNRKLDQEELKIVQDGAQFQAEQTYKYTELELEHGTDIPNEGQ